MLAVGSSSTLADQTIAVTAIIDDNGVRNDDFYTTDRTLVFSGTSNAANGSHVAVWLNGNFLAYVTVSGGAWSYDYRDHSLDDGYYNLRADLVDVAGNIAVSSSLRGFAIDNSGALLPDGTHDPLGDAAIAVTSIVTDSGISDSDFITNATSVTAHGTGAANAWMRVFLDGNFLGNTQVDGTGHWSYGMATPQGPHTISADYIDLAGNVVPGPAASHGMTVDTTAPTLQIQLPAGTAKGAETVYFNFNEGVSGFDASDVALTNASLSNFTRIDDAHYSANITPTGTGSGTLSLSVANGLYTDIAGNNGSGDAKSQAYNMGPPETLDLGIYGQGILPWQVPGTNKAYYYLDVNKDGRTDSWAGLPGNLTDDGLNYFELRDMFNGGADLKGQTFITINGHRIALPGDEVRESGDYYWSDSAYTGSSATFQGTNYTYNNIDDLYAVEYITQNKKLSDQQFFWTGEVHKVQNVPGSGTGVVVSDPPRLDPSSTPAKYVDIPATALMVKVDAATAISGVDFTSVSDAWYIGRSNEDIALNPSITPPDGNRWYSHFVVFMYEMPVI